MIKLGILDLGHSEFGLDDHDRILASIGLAEACDMLGYSRYWLAEHQDGNSVWRSQEIMMSILAGYTDHIKIGAAGVLLSVNSPLRVAQNFKLLGSLYPGRIDLGIARGGASDFVARELLNGLDIITMSKDFFTRMEKVLKYLREGFVKITDADDLPLPPINGALPDFWSLGSSGATMDFAIKEKLNYSMSLYLGGKESLAQKAILFTSFLEKYEKHNNIRPVANITISVFCGDNKADCDRFNKKNGDKIIINVIGELNDCYDQICTLCEQFKTTEVILYFPYTKMLKQLKVVEKFATIFNLKAPALNISLKS